jgi:MFS family permease
MPAFLASLGMGSAALGLIEGLADGASSIAKLTSGLYSDRLRRRKPLAVIGYLITASGMASLALATDWWHVLLGRLGAWIGRGARSPVRNVLLAEATTPETYGRAYGFERAMDSVGAVIGPLLSVGLVAAIGFRRTFAVTFLPGIIAALLIAVLVREREHVPQAHKQEAATIGALPFRFRRFLAGVGIAGCGDFSNTLLILWATQAWRLGYGSTRAVQLAMLFYVGYNLVYAGSCYISGHLADRFLKRRVLALGYALAIIPAAVLLWPGASLLKFGLIFGFSGLYMGVWETVESATAATMLPDRIRGSGFGVLATVNGLGDIVSSAAVGFLWAVSPAAAMALVIATSIVGAGIIASNPS